MSRESEIREAIVAANEALEHLRAAADELNSAGRWGMVDMMGGGFFTSAIKHGRLSNAQDEIQEAKRALKRFSRELRDVDEDAGLNVEVGGLLGFLTSSWTTRCQTCSCRAASARCRSSSSAPSARSPWRATGFAACRRSGGRISNLAGCRGVRHGHNEGGRCAPTTEGRPASSRRLVGRPCHIGSYVSAPTPRPRR